MVKLDIETAERLCKYLKALKEPTKEIETAIKRYKYDLIEYNNPIANLLKNEYNSIIKKCLLQHKNLPRNKLIKKIKEEVKRYPWNTWDEISFTITEIKKEVTPRKGQIPLPFIF